MRKLKQLWPVMVAAATVAALAALESGVTPLANWMWH
jgi:hypothetical protein